MADVANIEVNGTSYAVKDATAARRNVYYGTCTTAANTYKKVATVETFPLDSNGKPLVGTVVAIKYSNSNSYKTEGQTYQLNVNSTGDYPMYYNNAALATSTSANTLVAGYKNRNIFYMFDGSHWVWLTASYDSNTTYSGMTQAEVDAGTSTTNRLISPQRLRDNFYTEDEVDTLLADKADVADMPTKTSDLTNDSNFVQSTSLATVATSGSYNDLTNKPTIPTAATYAPLMDGTAAVGSSSKYAKEDHVHPSDTSKIGIVFYTDAEEMTNDTSQDAGTIGYVAEDEEYYIYETANVEWRKIPYNLATIATSGSYNDLTNKPTIPAAITVDSTITRNGANPVQGGAIYSALRGKAGTVYYEDVDEMNADVTQDSGTLAFVDDGSGFYIWSSADMLWYKVVNPEDLYSYVPTSRKVNNKALSSDITLTASDVGALPNTTTIPTKISDLTNDSGYITGYTETDPVFAASAAHGISSADISSWDAKADPVTIVTVSTTGAVTQALDPNKFYDFTGSPTSLTLTLNSGNDLCIYAGKFTAGTGFSNLTLPSTVKVADGAPSVEAGGVYEFSVMNNLLLLAKEGS